MENNLVDKLSETVFNRLKIPIITTYICVLIMYNWDIWYYLIFEKCDAVFKIQFIQSKYGDEYWGRIIYCLFLSILVLIVFTILNTLLNILLSIFYRKDKKMNSILNNINEIEKLRNDLALSLKTIESLKIKNQNLEVIHENSDLNFSNLNKDIITKREYSKLMNLINQENDLKLNYSLKELFDILNKNPLINYNSVVSRSTYKIEMASLLELLRSLKMIDFSTGTNRSIEISTVFSDIIKHLQ